jgi:sulfopyruvate decarboxylase alpha subunit
MAGDAQTETWWEAVVRVLKDNEVRLVCYVPDNILAQLIRLIESDPYFTTVCPAREEEAVGIVCGAYMAGMRGVVLMQTSGFATLPNVLASLVCVYQIPLLMMISERGVLGEFQLGQTAVCRTMRPVLDALAIDHFTLKERDDVDFVVGAMIKQAYATHVCGAVILSPMLTKRPARAA